MKLRHDTRGQDLIEFALISGLIAVALGAILPDVAGSVSTITSKVNSVLTLRSDNSSSNI